MVADQPLDAGSFSAWLTAVDGALDGNGVSDVQCGSCTACCTSSQFVHIEPDETAALARIPAELLFPAPSLPPGHVVLGYDEHGHCPMLVDGACSIYAHRPRTCRTYDCRVFAAAGVEVDDPRQAAIATRVRRWRFTYPAEADRAEHDAVREAARSAPVAGDAAPANATERAVLAVRVVLRSRRASR